jgi:hypothetical protein
MKRPRRNYHREYRRTPPGAQGDGKTFLIVVEGEETERLYLDGLRRKLELKSAHVEVVHAGATDPQNMVKAALKLRDARLEESKRSSILVPYDEVWVVIDREAKNDSRGKQLSAALAGAAAESILVALSNPAFEFWLVLHFEFTTKSFADAKAVERYLKAHHLPDYEKNDLPLETLLSKLADAVKHAAGCLKHHETCGGDGNPSTGVHLLAKSLNDSAAPVFRLM